MEDHSPAPPESALTPRHPHPNQPHIPLPPIDRLIAALEAMAALARPGEGAAPPARVVAIALNTGHLAADQAAAALEAMAPVYLQESAARSRFTTLRVYAGRKTREV